MSLDFFDYEASPMTSEITARPQKGWFSLQYILAGEAQLVKKCGHCERVYPGDSILAPHGHTLLQPECVSSHERLEIGRQSGWRMVSISLLLPKSLDRSNQDLASLPELGDPHGSEDKRRLSGEEVDWIVAGAKATAQDNASRQDSATVLRLPRAGQTGEQGEETSRLRGRASDAHDLSSSDTQTYRMGTSIDNEQEADSADGAEWQQSVPGPVTLEAALSNAVTTFGGLAQALQQLSRWRRKGKLGVEVLKKNIGELSSFRLPHQTNRLALVFDPLGDSVNFTFGVEIFEPGHKTTPHVHHIAHELFFILAGSGEGFCDDERFPISAGDIVVFPPGSKHGIDVAAEGKMYCLEVMQPNDMFAELVRRGMPSGSLLDDDLCILIASGCA